MKFFALLLSLTMSTAVPLFAEKPEAPKAPRKLEIKDGKFFLDNKPFQFICGEMHYPRIPRELWRDRLHKARVMGINCVSAYVFWSFHEKSPGEFDFTGNADIAEFIKIAGEEGLLVYLRPGPYVCAEYDFGGYPYWLQNIPDLKWRTKDPKFLALMERYLAALAKELAPLQLTKGGPIAFVQVENEYGSFGKDKEYLADIREMVKKAGFDVMLTTCDGPGQMPNGKVDGCLPTVNGAMGDDIFTTIDKNHKGGPYFVSEFYPAWFDQVGGPHAHKDKDTAAKQFDWMLSHGVNVSIYMFHGGTNFSFTNGANDPPYRPQTTSYDYDAPLSEEGNMTQKFLMMRDVVLKNFPDEKLPPVPAQPKVVTVAPFKLEESAPLSAAFGKPVKSENPQTFEEMQLDFGYMVYNKKIEKPVTGELSFGALNDYAFIYIDGKFVAQLDRRHGQKAMKIKIPKAPAMLSIIVENCGRTNYGNGIYNNKKGIVGGVTLAGEPLTGWESIPMPLHRANPGEWKFGASIPAGMPAFHRGSFELTETGEVFLDTGAWGKGVLWVNGHCLGKFWSVGPQQTMYLPSCWVKKGRNEVVAIEFSGKSARTLEGLAAPVLNKNQPDPCLGVGSVVRDGVDPKLDPGDLAAEATLPVGVEPQTVKFAKPVTARHIALEVLSARGEKDYAHCSEIEVLDSKGNSIPRKDWKIWFANSEETYSENGRADNLLDGNPDTFWHTAWTQAKSQMPHVVVIDMGDIKSGISAIRITPRPGHADGAIQNCRVFARSQFFLAK